MVAIKDMEMPSCCYECPYGYCVGSFSLCSIIGDDEIDIQEDYLAGTKYEYCPLVEIEEYNVEKLKKIKQIIEHLENSKIVTNCCECVELIKKVLEQE